MRIAVNAGHCPGLDSGACGRYSTEADIVRDVAKVVCEDLELIGYKTIFIQEDELQDICDIANDFNADVFCSIHCNACASHAAEGTETFHAPGSDLGYILSKCLQHQLLTTMGSYNRGIKEANFYVLRHTDMPAALCELDFIDNPECEKYLNEHIEEMGHAIARGITDYSQEVEVWD